MNFLAHLFLSCDNEDLLIGNFIADFIRNKEVENYPESVQKGIHLHRQIDSFTDNHPIVKQSVHRLQPHHHKYAAVVIDIVYDHLLAVNWSRYSGQSLATFANDVYDVLEKRMTTLPSKLQKRLPGMIAGNWLEAYATQEGILFTLKKMDERTRFPSNFGEALKHLTMDYDLFEAEFYQFFPELMAYVESNCKC